ncbi:hypothetical protein GCM10020000_32060 [Streptomyces olivoverticillatus]
MTAQILDGKATAAAIKSELTSRVEALKAKGVVPGLGTLLVGEDPGSKWYVAGKHRDCAQVGIGSIQRELPDTATQEEIEAVVRELNENPECTGYIVQLPLPKGIDTNRVLELIDPAKDADGLHPTNLGRLVLNESAPLPCTPPTASSSCCAGTAWRSTARTSWSSAAASPWAGRSGCCSPASPRTPPSPSATPAPVTSPRSCARPTSSWRRRACRT